MTTNGILLGKYIKYLVDNDFILSISIDGDEKGNSFRVDHNNNKSFDLVYSNLKMIQKKYPEYFKTNIRLLSVLHSKNSHDEIYSFLEKEFDKTPVILPLSTNNINEVLIEKFVKTWNDPTESYTKYKNNCNGQIPLGKDLMANSIARYSLGLSFKMEFKTLRDFANFNLNFLSGTCVPFYRNVFMKADGNLTYCERIPDKYSLGCVKNNHVRIDYENIAKNHNNMYDKVSNMCYKCYRVSFCRECLLVENNLGECSYYSNREKVKDELKDMIDYIEIKNSNYYKSVKEITFS